MRFWTVLLLLIAACSPIYYGDRECSDPACEPIDLDAGLLAYWPFDETDGDTAADATGNGHNGTLDSMFDSWVAGRFNNALQFPGEWGHVTFSSLDGPNFPLNGTLSLWIHADWFANQDARPFWDGWSDVRNLMAFGMTPGPYDDRYSDLIFFAMDNRTTTTTVCYYETVMLNNTWQHLALVWDTDINTTTLYLDNTWKYTCDTTTDADGIPIAAGWVPDGQQAIIGKGHETQTFKGRIDNVRLYNRALEPVEIEALFNE